MTTEKIPRSNHFCPIILDVKDADFSQAVATELPQRLNQIAIIDEFGLFSNSKYKPDLNCGDEDD